MDKAYDFKKAEKEIYNMWEKGGYFAPTIDPSKKPFTILLPPPNASGKMHTGNVLMIAIEDLLIRWHRMKGDPTLWVPGTDHAGFETQTTFERELKKQGKSRFDFDSKTLYQMIWDFVQQNKHLIEGQLRQMGASVDWSRYTFTLDDQVVKTVCDTFAKMEKDGIIYRGYQLVNYSFKWGTTFSDAEIQYKEQVDPLYYIRYNVVDRKDKEPQYLTVATVRPETIFIDTHLAVNPKDKKNSKWIGRQLYNPLTDEKMEIIGESFVDPKFGTGIVKLTPAHDKADYEVAKKRTDIPIRSVINHEGKFNEKVKQFGKIELDALFGQKVKDGREKVVKILEEKDCIEKVNKEYLHQVPVDYRSGDYIENLVLPNWFVNTAQLKKPAYVAIKKGELKIFPKWREITYLRWLENMRDWPISRQIVWGIRIPIWYKVTSQNEKDFWVIWVDAQGVQHKNTLDVFLKEGKTLGEIKAGLQRVITLTEEAEKDYIVSQEEPNEGKYLPETDTFDTWFSSGQWPLVTLGYPNSEDFKYFYPTSVLETGWEIVTRWVSRMVMFGYYLTGQSPFEYVYLHGIVKALDGRKMSKSLGNVINPEEYIEQYGVDALRMGLISGTANGKDFAFPKDRVIAYKHFGNKIWNMARFMLMMMEQYGKDVPFYSEDMEKQLKPEDKEILKGLSKLIKLVDSSLEKFRMADAGEAIYQFMWHELADKYIEQVKNREDKDIALSVLRHVYIHCLKLLHPFMPYITEEIWGLIPNLYEKPLIIASWPEA